MGSWFVSYQGEVTVNGNRWRALFFFALVLAMSVGSFPLTQSQAFAQDTSPGKTVNLQLIVDASGSMGAATDTGVLRIDAAKQVLNEVIGQIPEAEGIDVGFRVYGHKGDNTDVGRPESCISSELMVPMQGVDKAALTAQVGALQPVGWTPLGFSLQEAAMDFTQPAGEDVVNAIIMVTDGLETCDADPAAISAELKTSPAGITTHVIGFGTTPDELAILNGITQASGGQLLGSNNAGQLMSSLFTILEELEVVEEGGAGESREAPIAVGRVGQVGDYDVSVLSAGGSPVEHGTTGGREYSVRVALTYKGSRVGRPSRDLEFGAYGKLGVGYPTQNSRCERLSEDLFSVPDLFQNGSAETNVCWVVADSDVDSLVMYVNATNGPSQGRVWFSLGSSESITTDTDNGGGAAPNATYDLEMTEMIFSHLH
jgi:hypothetical protein